MSVKPEILARFIEGLDVPYTQNGSSWIFRCPRCEKAKKLYVRKRDGLFVCFHCKEEGYRGDAEFALADLSGLPLHQVKATLYGDGGPSADAPRLVFNLIDFFAPKQPTEELTTELPEVVWPFEFYPLDHPHSAKGVAYLEKRGIPIEIAQQYHIRYSPQLRQVIFPVISHHKLYGWQGRVITPTKIINDDGSILERGKSQTMTGFRSDKALMFADRLEGVDHAVLCEGPIDALKAHLCGGNVCSMGKGVSSTQIALLRNSGKRKLYLGLDPDAADDVMRICKELDSSLEVYLMELPRSPDRDKMDLGRLSMEEVYDIFKRAKRITSGHLVFWIDPS